MPSHCGPAGEPRPARIYVPFVVFLALVAGLLSSAVEAQQSWRILVLRVDFPFEQIDEPTTSAQGKFDLRPLAEALPDYQLPYDTPPHDRTHYENHLQALARYYETVSEGQVSISSAVYPLADTLAYTLPTSALRYGNGRTPEEIDRKWRELAVDAFSLAEADAQGPDFSAFDSYLIIHAGLGHETGQLNDVRSVFLGPQDLAGTGGPIPVDGGTHQVRDLWILPEAVDDRGRAGLNGLLAKFFGHQLGLPGLSNFGDGLPGVGGWSLMDVGANRIGFVLHGDQLDYAFGVVPPHPLAWSKARLGWIDALTVARDTTVTIVAGDRPLASGQTKAVRLPLSPTEAIWLENRQQRARTEFDLPAGTELPFGDLELGWITPAEAQLSLTITAEASDSLAGRAAGVWLVADEYDAFVPGAGVLAWHVDNAVIQTAPQGFNNDRERPGVVLKEADGYRDIGNFFFDRQDLTEGTRSDVFYHGIGVNGTMGTDRLEPANTRTNTGLLSGVDIEVLSAPGDAMQVRLRFRRNLPGWPRTLLGAHRVQGADLDGIETVLAVGSDQTALFTQDGDLSLPGRLLAASDAGVFVADPAGVSAYSRAGDMRWSVAPESAVTALVSESVSGIGAALVLGDSTGLRVLDPADGALLFADDVSTSGLSAADIDGDGEDDLMATGHEGLRRYDGMRTTAMGPGAGHWLAPTAADLDGDGAADVILVDTSGRIVTAGLAQELNVQTGTAPTAAPALADVDGDGVLEILVLTASKLHVYTAVGLRAAGFPAAVPVFHEAGDFVGEPVAADLDGDGTQELFAAAANGVYGFDARGATLPGFPVLSQAVPSGTPLLLDADGDGGIDIFVPAGDLLQAWRPSVWDSAFAAGNAGGWTQMAGGPAGLRQHRGSSQAPSPQAGAALVSSAYCYPNPVGDTEPATVRFFLARPATASIRVYDAIGNQVDHLQAHDLRDGVDNEITWPIDSYASGLYLCHLSARGTDGTHASVTLRMAVRR